MLEEVKKRVCVANKKLAESGLIILTWGNVSEIDREKGLVVIKPSGVDYKTMTPDDMVVVSAKTGIVVEGKYKPSSDTPTHLELYKRFPQIGGIVHTHSINAVAFAQAGLDIPAFGTTHADYFNGDIPCTRELTQREVEKDYEKNTGKIIIEELERRGFDVMSIPCVLVKNHGPFSWGVNAEHAVNVAEVLEKVAEIAIKTILLNSKASMERYILDKHYHRKNGPNAYYGQKRIK